MHLNMSEITILYSGHFDWIDSNLLKNASISKYEQFL